MSAAVIVVLAVGTIATAAAAASALRPRDIYWTSLHVTFPAPYGTATPNTLSVSTDSLVTRGDTHAQIVSDEVTLADQGVTHGYSIRLPNDGGQWAINYDQPYLDVQVIGTSPAEVEKTLRSVTSRIATTLSAIQPVRHVNRINTPSTQWDPADPPLAHSGGRPHRAALATLLLGGALTTAAALACVHRRRRRSTTDPPTDVEARSSHA